MTSRRIDFTFTPSQTLYAFFVDDINNWGNLGTLRILGTEISPGYYTFTVDDTNGYNWMIFKGGTQPASFNEGISGIISVEPVSISVSTTNQINGNILPVNSQQRQRFGEELIEVYYQEVIDVTIFVNDENGPVDLTSKTLEFIIETKNKVNLQTISNSSIVKGNGYIIITLGTIVTNTVDTYIWALRDLTGAEVVLSTGTIDVKYAPRS